MKTKTLVLACLLLGIGLARLSAQSGKNENVTIPDGLVWDGYYIPVFSSNGGQIDWLAGSASYHRLYHFKDGVPLWKIELFKGEAVSVGLDWISGTGEIFKISDQFSIPLTAIPYIVGGHINAIGNLGTHYIIFYEYSFYPVTWVETYSLIRAVLPGIN